MQTLPISKVKDKLNEYVDSVAGTRDQVMITKNGSPAAVLIGADEWESIQETLFWLSQPGIRDTIAEAEADISEGRLPGEDESRGLSPGREISIKLHLDTTDLKPTGYRLFLFYP